MWEGTNSVNILAQNEYITFSSFVKFLKCYAKTGGRYLKAATALNPMLLQYP